MPREWLDFESIMVLTSMRKVTLEHGPYIARCPSRPIATLVFSWSDREVGFEKYKGRWGPAPCKGQCHQTRSIMRVASWAAS